MLRIERRHRRIQMSGAQVFFGSFKSERLGVGRPGCRDKAESHSHDLLVLETRFVLRVFLISRGPSSIFISYRPSVCLDDMWGLMRNRAEQTFHNGGNNSYCFEAVELECKIGGTLCKISHCRRYPV